MDEAPPPVPVAEGVSSSPPPPAGSPPRAAAEPGTTRGAGRRIDDGKGRVFPCEQCGADVVFDVGAQRMKCPFCSWEKDLSEAARRTVAEQDYEAGLRRIADRRGQARKVAAHHDAHEVRCEACGANVVFLGSLTSSHCSFCGVPVQRDKVHDAEERIPVDGVLPFQVGATAAREILRKWVLSRWFAPGEFRRRGVDAKFDGVYVPYWTFDSLTFSRWSGRRGEHHYVTVGTGKNRRTVRHTTWHRVSGAFDLPFDDVLVVAAKALPTDLLQSLEPWPLGRLVTFNAEMLAGFLAQTYDRELPEGFQAARARMEEAIREETRRRIGGDEQRIDSIESTYDAVTYKHLLLPVWLLAYRWKEKTHRVVVNAVTGEIQGTRPWSAWKIAGLVVAILAAVVLVAAVASR